MRRKKAWSLGTQVLELLVLLLLTLGKLANFSKPISSTVTENKLYYHSRELLWALDKNIHVRALAEPDTQ